MSFTKSNCALGAGCTCAKDPKYFNCPNWGRSTLSVPAIIGRDPQYGGGGKKVERAKKPSRLDYERTVGALRRDSEKRGKHFIETEKRLREVRHTDPRKHLRSKGIKV